MPGLIGKKIGMTSVFGADGKNIPCTVIECGPCVVTQVKTVETDGYAAVQLGFLPKTEKHTNKAEAGHFAKAGVQPMTHLVEFSGFEQELHLGDTITVDMFKEKCENNKAYFIDLEYHPHGVPGEKPNSIIKCNIIEKKDYPKWISNGKKKMA